MQTLPTSVQIAREAEALYRAGGFADAVARYGQLLALKPNNAAVHANLGAALLKLGRRHEALTSAETALRHAPRLAEAHVVRGEALFSLGRFEPALKSFEEAIAIAPASASAHTGRGNALLMLKRFTAAAESYDATLALKPAARYVQGHRLFAKLNICAWDGIEAEIAAIKQAIQDGHAPAVPFEALVAFDSDPLHRTVAERFAATEFPARENLGPIPARVRRDKIRVGYFSADFHDHPLGRHMAEVFECHDHTAVEIVAFSYGPPIIDATRTRIEAAFDRFFDVYDLDDREIAAAARREEIDIAVNLSGWTTNSRPGVFALRAAPVQVNFLGYPGTMGASFIDYIIADRFVIPPENEQHFSESIALMPHSYFPNDTRKDIAATAPSRAECGLPEGSFVFCCFNSNQKITPTFFDIWTRLLKGIPSSVLWFSDLGPTAIANLNREAKARGIAADRLIFAPRLPAAEHLARHRHADLFLDTLPFNAHSTMSDVLWSGLPAITCAGGSFAGRVGASMLSNIGLGELVTTNLADYEALAFSLAGDRARLARLRTQLAETRRHAPLFDTMRYTRNLEEVYVRMWANFQSGGGPQRIELDPR